MPEEFSQEYADQRKKLRLIIGNGGHAPMQYKCGHTGAARFYYLTGENKKIAPEPASASKLCPECFLLEIRKLAIHNTP